MTSRLADRPMRTLDEVTVEVSWCWKSITRKDISEVFIEMKERMQEELSLKETLLATNLAVFCLGTLSNKKNDIIWEFSQTSDPPPFWEPLMYR